MSLAEEPVVLAPQITESETAWSFQKLRGGRSNSDADRILMFCLILVFCGALVTGVVGTTLYVVKSNANVSHFSANTRYLNGRPSVPSILSHVFILCSVFMRTCPSYDLRN